MSGYPPLDGAAPLAVELAPDPEPPVPDADPADAELPSLLAAPALMSADPALAPALADPPDPVEELLAELDGAGAAGGTDMSESAVCPSPLGLDPRGPP